MTDLRTVSLALGFVGCVAGCQGAEPGDLDITQADQALGHRQGAHRRDVATTLDDLGASVASTVAGLVALGVGESALGAPLGTASSARQHPACGAAISSLGELFGALRSLAERGLAQTPHELVARADCLSGLLDDVEDARGGTPLDHATAKLLIASLSAETRRVACVAERRLPDGLARCTLAAALDSEKHAVAALQRLAAVEIASATESAVRCASVRAELHTIAEGGADLGREDLGASVELARAAVAAVCPVRAGLDALSAGLEPLALELARFGTSEVAGRPAAELARNVAALDAAFVGLGGSGTCRSLATDACVTALRSSSVPAGNLDGSVAALATLARRVDEGPTTTEGANAPDLVAATRRMQETQMSFNLQYLQLQSQMQHENRSYTAISNIMKTKHDTVKNSISNIR